MLLVREIYSFCSSSFRAEEILREEFTDFQLSPDLPSLSTYKAADSTQKPCAGVYWSHVGRMTTLDGQPRFGSLCKLMFALLCIPCSNADSERGFSMLHKIHTDERASFDQSTIVALMGVKLNSNGCCTDVTIDKELLVKCKKATVTYLKKTVTTQLTSPTVYYCTVFCIL